MHDSTPASFLLVDQLKRLVRDACAEIDDSIQQMMSRQTETNRLLTEILAGLGKDAPPSGMNHPASAKRKGDDSARG